MAVAMGILAGIAILMGMLKIEHLAKGLAAVTVLGLVMSTMIKSTWGVEKCMGELIVMVAAVGLMAAAAAGLSMIEPGPLWNAVAAMSVLMGMFALVAKSSSNINTSWGTMASIAGIILILSGVIYLLAKLPITSVLGSAVSLSVLLLSLTGSLKILSTIHSMSMGAFAAMGILVLIVAALAVVLGIMSALDCAPSIETALAISTLLLTMSAVYAVLGLTGGLAGTAIAGAAGMMGVIAIIGAVAIAIGALMSLIPDDKLAEWKVGLESFMDFITILATGLGEAIGGLVGGILDGVASGIDTFAGSMGKLTEALGPFADAAKKLGGSVKFVNAIHYIKGEGIEKKEDNFAEEVAAQIAGAGK
jgi:hypothetical protein